MSHDINILVNGNRCKQYHHDGKIFIEAKEGSEYSIEIKNNEWKRILAVCSVDGLDILNGKPATEDGPGYVLSAFNNAKFDGFRVSDDKVAKFVFGAKGSSYAASKADGSERNVGVIGIRLFSEKEKPVTPAPIVIREDHYHYPNNWPWDTCPGTPVRPWNPYPIWCDSTWSRSFGGNTLGNAGDIRYGCSKNAADGLDMMADNAQYSADLSSDVERGPSRSTAKGRSAGITAKATLMNAVNNAQLAGNEVLRGFDMGTKWGEAKESKVVEVEFERGVLILTTNIYYASRQSLLEMGVPLGSEKQVSFPEPFADSKYAKPPKGWKA